MNILISLILPFLLISNIGFSQSDTLNQTDTSGMKQGYWIFYGVDKPEKGWCDSCKIEEGHYLNNRKDRDWIKYYQDGVTPKLKVAYTRGRPSGYYTKYYESGKIKTLGNFERGKHIKSISYYESGCIQQEIFYNELDRKEIKYFYYNTCDTAINIKGQIITETVQGKISGGFLIYKYYPNGEFKEIITYSEDGIVLKTEKFEKTKKPYVQEEIDKKDVVYYFPNPNDESHMEGEFRSGKLWNGKQYIYDTDGILLRIEIWKEGKYYSDEPFESTVIFDTCNSKYTEDDNQDFIWDGKCVNGKPWEGKMYIYDSAGILLKIEIWKEGRYHSDGQL